MSWVYCTDEPLLGSVILHQIVNNYWCAKIKKNLLGTLISTSLRKKNSKIKILSLAVFFYTPFPVLRAEKKKTEDTHMRLLGIILCPSLYHVTRGRGKEAIGGWWTMAARPWVTVFLCSLAEKFPRTKGKSYKNNCIKLHSAREDNNEKDTITIGKKKNH